MPQGRQNLTSPDRFAATRGSHRKSLRPFPAVPRIPATRTFLHDTLSGGLPTPPAFTGFAANAYRHWITRRKDGHLPLSVPAAAATGFRQPCRLLPDRKSRIPEGIRTLLRPAGTLRPATLAANRFALSKLCRAFAPQGRSCASLCQAVCIAAGFRRPRCTRARLPVTSATRTHVSGNRTGLGSR